MNLRKFDQNRNSLIDKIKNTPFKTDPWPFLDMEQVFDDIFLDMINISKPPNSLFVEGMIHHTVEREDGSSPRYHFLPEDNDDEFWLNVKNNIFNDELKNVMIDKLGITQECESNMRLIRDYKDYWIPIHTDSPAKTATLMVYLPQQNCCFTYGTSFYNEKFEERYRIPYTNGRAFLLARSDTNWHGCHMLTKPDTMRDSIMFTLWGENDKHKI